MTHGWRAGLTALVLAGAASLTMAAADSGVSFIGMGTVPGDALDKSGLAGTSICKRDDATTCIDNATMGGFGSALAYTGLGNIFLAVPDRGPFDGRTNVPYRDRFHFLNITVDPNAFFPNIKTTLLDTGFLQNRTGKSFVGDAYAFDVNQPEAARRLDPEGAAVGRLGTFFISDEYGPYVREFDAFGRLIRSIRVPDKFAIASPSGDIDSAGNSLELYPDVNTAGRQANRGMEGLAITPDGRYLVGIMQNALIQDHGLNDATPPGRVGLNNRIVKFDLLTGKTREYVYTVDAINQGRGVNEILAVNDHEFLVLERDNRTFRPTPPNDVQAPALKRLYKIDLNKAGLTDVSNIPSLPTSGAELAALSIVPVDKTLFLDLLDPSYKINATQTIKDVIAEKIEGISWGPDLRDGRHVLYVISDNDLYPGLPTQIYAFAVDGAKANIRFERQQVILPLYVPLLRLLFSFF